MKTFINPLEFNQSIGEFVYSGCRYSGIDPGLKFSVLSVGLAQYLEETFPFLEVQADASPIADNEHCCSKCNRDCGSAYMKERHEKACKEEAVGLAMILKPSYIFWNFKDLDRTQLTEDQLIPSEKNGPVNPPQFNVESEKDITEPAPGRPGMAMIGKRMEKVTIDRDGTEWYGDGLQDDPVR